MPVKKIMAGGKPVLIAMTDSEAKDKSYVDYMTQAQIEKAKNEKPKPVEKRHTSVEETGKIINEFNQFRKRQQSEHPRKYF